ncbi:S9 family peptidase [Microbacterium sp. G2-8]|uniref:alpha/beta hydrolase family protein n=1 Tax=Microbacterium sp. G2-8 TaxID=2842454 RepID=UPI001C8AF31E|nr:prolyl oligopeptidase family serine peptidase [Microbacterium sp. G2-8]
MAHTDQLAFGTWPSPIRPEDMPTGSLRLGRARYVGDEVWWAESVPSERGRTAIFRSQEGTPVLPAPWSARSRVHEYGGGAWTVTGDERVAFVHQADQRIYSLVLGEGPAPLTPADSRFVFGDLVFAEDALWAVRETHEVPHETPLREIVRIPLDGAGATDPEAIVSVVGGSDFVAYPAPRAGRLAWIAWDHPDMPWDAAELRVGTLDADGRVSSWIRAAGGRGVADGKNVSALQPEWTGDEELMFLADPPIATGEPDAPARWNLYWLRFDEGLAVAGPDPIFPVDADTGGALWSLGSRWYAALADGRVVAVVTNGRSELLIVDPTGGAVTELETPLTGDVQIHDVRGERVLLTGAGADVPGGLWQLDVDARSLEALRGGEIDDVPGLRSVAEPLTFSGPNGPVHAFYYPPSHPVVTAPDGELPPVLVLVHGGPTGHVSGDLSQGTAFFTSRGIGVLDVNYGGSSGYGRAYRERLNGGWGVSDVQDVAAAAQGLVNAGLADPRRLAIKGGSAGGWTVLCALADTDVFSAGISRYGVADLRLLLAETHDFEARYVDSLVGPWPEAEQEYIDRSPLSRPESLTTPLLILQGTADPVVPPSQSEALRDALAANDVPYAYILFDGESHGFRQAETIVKCFASELAFLGEVLGFETPGVDPLTLS